jgi:aspartate/methionine/tyrosine aminotransferase
MAATRVGFLAGHPDLLQAVTFVRMPIGKAHTNLLAQHGVLAAIQDFEYVKMSEEIMRRNLKHLAETVEMTEGCFIPVMPKYGFAITIDISGTDVTAQELCVALTKRKIALYPGDGLGDVGATTTIRLNYSRPDIEPFELFRDALPEAIAEAGTGIYAERIAEWYEQKGTPRGLRIAQEIREKRMK